MDKIRVDINRHYQEVMQTDGFVTGLIKVKNAYLGLGVKQDTFLTLFAKHNQEFSLKSRIQQGASELFQILHLI